LGPQEHWLLLELHDTWGQWFLNTGIARDMAAVRWWRVLNATPRNVSFILPREDQKVGH
jgi:hypothetical protein